MHARHHRGVSSDGVSPEITLRPAAEEDVAFLLDLRIRTMDEHFAASGRALSEEEHRQRVLHRFACAEIVLVDGEESGILKLDRDATPWHLIQVQLLPELHGRGVGTRLLREVVRQARAAAIAVQLDVLKVNPARRLYERLGFVVAEDEGDSLAMRLPA